MYEYFIDMYKYASFLPVTFLDMKSFTCLSIFSRVDIVHYTLQKMQESTTYTKRNIIIRINE